MSSIEKALVNCRRCYSLAKLYGFDSLSTKNIGEAGDFWNARNDALDALEGVDNSSLGASAAKQACVLCDYSRPMMVVSLAKSSKRTQYKTPQKFLELIKVQEESSQ